MKETPIDPITIAMGLAQFVPQIVKWIGGDKAGTVAQKVVDVAQQVTGKPTGDEALKALQADPNLVLQYRKAILDQEVAFEQLAVQNAADVNKTMQAEDGSSHWPTYSWRPWIGFNFGLNLTLASVLVIMVFVAQVLDAKGADKAIAALPAALGALAAINALATPILGIASWFRGKMQADPSIPTDNRG
jgi:hypothetical protein